MKRTRSISPSKRERDYKGPAGSSREHITEPKKQKVENVEETNHATRELHPLLRASTPTTVITKSYNPVKQSKNRTRPGYVVNPYLDQNDMSMVPVRPKRVLNFNEKGKYIQKGEELRAKLDEERKEKERQEALRLQGLTANEVLGEQFYKSEFPPVIEWWDKELIKDKNYNHLDELDRLTYLDAADEENPISIYVQHPVPIRAPWEKHLPPLKPLFLTKKELKKLRKNERALKHKEKQDRIILGLDPPPPPKVKLKNLMNVLTNDAIKNPTEVEMRVKKEIEERRIEHERMNEERKATSEEKHEREHMKKEKDLDKGYFSKVYKIDRLVNPQHVFKLDMNAKQLEMRGMILKLKSNTGFSLIIVEGGEKIINFYDKLVRRRIKWNENSAPRKKNQMDIDGEAKELEDLSSNKCTLLWEGQLSHLHFQKWTIYDINDDEEALDLLGKYRLDNYWRQAAALN